MQTTRKWIKLVRTLCAVMLATPILAGCWDRLEIEERAVVLGVSIDKVKMEEAEEEEDAISHLPGTIPAPNKDMIRVAVQIALPGRIPLGPGESGGGGGGSVGKTVWVIDVVGHSLNDAFMNLQQQVSSKLFFGHLRVIVISEAVARNGLENINDYFRRNSEVRRMAWMMVAKGQARKLMLASPPLERVPTLYLMSTLDEGIRMGKFPKDYIGIFWSNVSKKGQEGFLPYVEIKKEQNVEIKGLAYFVGDHMVGVTRPLEIAGYLAIKGINPAGYRVFVQLGSPEQTIMTTATHRRSKIKVQIKDDVPHFTIDIGIELNVEGKVSDKIQINNPDVLKLIEEKQGSDAIKFYYDIIKESQEKGSDYFGFGEIVRGRKPQYWNKRIKTAEEWSKMYENCTFEVKVAMKVRRIGMKGV
ncbi:Ger(x)C family spore germination protein [Paenibacillus sp. JDR-2]|uniref:Ger(x)C family spore germination protein n=1 Tax=Paenibacillus sp. (strain JDR-2) TaxID=324057 RepID=UPI0001665995|nr:Ger(x)C family spore germination protein [Paenibacillus sp. JDR-2]ACT01785.1 germination protein, Ger(x)C family [Paenibacillus sp. JDR-2]